MHTFSGWVKPENEAARSAVERVAVCVGSARPRRAVNPLLLHGPPGVGKTHLVQALAAEVSRFRPDVLIAVRSATDWASPAEDGPDPACDCDLLAVEDVQHLPARAAEALVGLLDGRIARHRQTVLTASAGPAGLTHLP